MKLMLVLLSLFAFSVQAQEKPEFIMSEAHCAVLKQHAIMAITAKNAGVDYNQYVRERVEGYGKLSGMERVIYLDILPFTFEMAYEYFNSDFNANTPYEEVIESHCLERVGSGAR
ncbi:hypothetical protein D3C87_715520 [compost metagenome]